MYIALNKNNNSLVDIETVLENRNIECICPVCKTDLIVKNGSFVKMTLKYRYIY